MKSVNRMHSFGEVPAVEMQRSVFDLSHGHKTTFDGGYLIPFLADEILPGDTYKVNATIFARLSTPIVPFMDNLYCDVFYFYVPNRLLWSNWVKFCGEQVNPGDSIDYLVPEIAAPAGGFAVGSLFDYLGVPTGINGLKCSALYARAYNLIWNEWFRDENLQNQVYKDVSDTGEAYTNYAILKRTKKKDYFTSCLPWPQKGSAVGIGIGVSAPIVGSGSTNWSTYLSNHSAGNVNVRTTSAANVYVRNTDGTAIGSTIPASNENIYAPVGSLSHGGTTTSFISQLSADLSSASSITINSLRQSFQIQRLLERDARGGSRYTEILLSHFKVVSPDFRLQRPEYLGGGSYPIMVTPVTQTSATSGSSPLGNLSGVGVLAGAKTGFSKSFTEHGILLGLVNVRADISYQQGLNRQFSRRTRYDYYWPPLAMLGEQAVLNKEIYAQGPTVLDAGLIVDDKVFGYQERHAEYRFKPSLITGKFRSSAAGTLHIWHLSQSFSSLPVLNSSFLEQNPPLDRVLAVSTEPEILFDSYISIKAVRPMPVYGVPGMIDHF